MCILRTIQSTFPTAKQIYVMMSIIFFRSLDSNLNGVISSSSSKSQHSCLSYLDHPPRWDYSIESKNMSTVTGTQVSDPYWLHMLLNLAFKGSTAVHFISSRTSIGIRKVNIRSPSRMGGNISSTILFL